MGGSVIKWLVLLAMVMGCEETWAPTNLGRDAVYFRDARTQLCFVYWITWSKGGQREVASNVPCRPEVLTLILETEQAAKLLKEAEKHD